MLIRNGVCQSPQCFIFETSVRLLKHLKSFVHAHMGFKIRLKRLLSRTGREDMGKLQYGEQEEQEYLSSILGEHAGAVLETPVRLRTNELHKIRSKRQKTIRAEAVAVNDKGVLLGYQDPSYGTSFIHADWLEIKHEQKYTIISALNSALDDLEKQKYAGKLEKFMNKEFDYEATLVPFLSVKA